MQLVEIFNNTDEKCLSLKKAIHFYDYLNIVLTSHIRQFDIMFNVFV